MEDFAIKWIVDLCLDVLHANYLRLDEEEEPLFKQRVFGAAEELDEGIMTELLASFDFDSEYAPGWREHLVGSWFCGLKGWQQFSGTIGDSLLASETCYAGQGYCFALACFATEESADYLIKYLDVYLPRIDAYYDQEWAMPALMWIDEQRGTKHAARFLVPGGLWEEYKRDKPAPQWDIEMCKHNFWAAMNYCQAHFGQLGTS